MTENLLPPDNALTLALKAAPIVPLVQSNNPKEAVMIARALLDGGLKVLEVVLRTDEALSCLRTLTAELPQVQVGAGTVLNAGQAEKAIDAGAKFIVSPGLSKDVVQASHAADIPVLPGIATATELQSTWNMGLRTVKFFPASLAGGPKMLKALSSVFRDVTFMPTGGVNAANLRDYLDIPAVIARGGSWLTPEQAVEAGNFDVMTELSREALSIAQS